MDLLLPSPSEELRKKLLQEELKLRKKQPEHWAKTKYRKYARPFKPAPTERIYAEEPHEIENAAAKKSVSLKNKSAKKSAKKSKSSKRPAKKHSGKKSAKKKR